eukprot:142484-Amphidinium_carterae.2
MEPVTSSAPPRTPVSSGGLVRKGFHVLSVGNAPPPFQKLPALGYAMSDIDRDGGDELNKKS